MEKTSTSTNHEAEYEFKKSIFFPWAKVKMRLDKKQLIVTDRNYLLWTIPIGPRKDRVISLDNVMGITGKFRFGINATIAGLMFVFAFVYFISSFFLADVIVGFVLALVFSPFLILGLFCLSKGVSCKLYTMDHKKEKEKRLKKIDISVLEEGKLIEFVHKINQTIKKH
jgi:hypothetical protein